MDGDIFIYSTESSNAELSEQKSLKIFFSEMYVALYRLHFVQLQSHQSYKER